jgi:hypothetical protein
MRRRKAPAGRSPLLRFGRLEIDRDARVVRVDGEERPLTGYQFDLLAALAASAGRVLGREALMARAGHDAAAAFDRSVDVHVSRIRAAIEDDREAPSAADGPRRRLRLRAEAGRGLMRRLAAGPPHGPGVLALFTCCWAPSGGTAGRVAGGSAGGGSRRRRRDPAPARSPGRAAVRAGPARPASASGGRLLGGGSGSPGRARRCRSRPGQTRASTGRASTGECSSRCGCRTAGGWSPRARAPTGVTSRPPRRRSPSSRSRWAWGPGRSCAG